MTRDAEHTPNGYEDAASVVVNQVPAPSSLAGGEVWAALEPFAKVADTALCPSDEPDDNDFIRLDETIAITVADIRRAASVFAALSPEAPAREDARGICEALGFDPTNHHNAAACPYCIPDEALRNEIKARALTPRHEAPASEDEVRRKLIQCIEQWDGETEYDADDLASLADSILHAFNGPPVVSPAAPVQLSSHPCQLEAPAEGAGEREEIARIVDPAAFKRFDKGSFYADHIPREKQMEWTPRTAPSRSLSPTSCATSPSVCGSHRRRSPNRRRFRSWSDTPR
ncbi:hypothetical protein [Brevundimonas bullata]|uniref:hypothetical protein n=1 Tax=Brevundimonas bullata TaxID=13160 RepID=UPI002FDB6BCF